ncbi:TetR/AcrR family transcriptional regulator [Nocardia sp. NPDC051750]|uniref:TetR/AcrR family transcriptional regulator n=1 Tax=Nocardia sp. NPDC051750 TaxID=3364325 RepID=UPI0037A19649
MSDPAARPRRGRGRPAGSDGADTRERILRVARELFSEVGYHRTTFTDIAARADITRTNINHYFRSKDDLYRTLFESDKGSVLTAGIADAQARTDLADRIAIFLRTAMQVDAGDPVHTRFLAASLFDALRNPDLGDWATEQIDYVRGFLRAALETAAAEGEIRPDIDIPTVTEMLIAAIWGMAMYAGFVGTREQLEPMVDQFAGLLRGALA